MSTPRVILCEKSGRWAVAFRRALAEQGELILQTRSLAEAVRQLTASPASIVAVEATAGNLEAVLAEVPQWLRRFPHCRVVGLLGTEVQAAETLLREAGAVAVLTATRDAPSATGVIRRHLESAPQSELPLEQAIERSLPWSKWATQSV
jgi:hypothetical protein